MYAFLIAYLRAFGEYTDDSVTVHLAKEDVQYPLKENNSLDIRGQTRYFVNLRLKINLKFSKIKNLRKFPLLSLYSYNPFWNKLHCQILILFFSFNCFTWYMNFICKNASVFKVTRKAVQKSIHQNFWLILKAKPYTKSF